jgi:hypothetical protein
VKLAFPRTLFAATFASFRLLFGLHFIIVLSGDPELSLRTRLHPHLRFQYSKMVCMFIHGIESCPLFLRLV